MPPRVATDGEGIQVLGRSVNGEAHFRHFVGAYSVGSRASDGERYVDVSSHVSIRCGV